MAQVAEIRMKAYFRESYTQTRCQRIFYFFYFYTICVFMVFTQSARTQLQRRMLEYSEYLWFVNHVGMVDWLGGCREGLDLRHICIVTVDWHKAETHKILSFVLIWTICFCCCCRWYHPSIGEICNPRCGAVAKRQQQGFYLVYTYNPRLSQSKVSNSFARRFREQTQLKYRF